MKGFIGNTVLLKERLEDFKNILKDFRKRGIKEWETVFIESVLDMESESVLVVLILMNQGSRFSELKAGMGIAPIESFLSRQDFAERFMANIIKAIQEPGEMSFFVAVDFSLDGIKTEDANKIISEVAQESAQEVAHLLKMIGEFNKFVRTLVQKNA